MRSVAFALLLALSACGQKDATDSAPSTPDEPQDTGDAEPEDNDGDGFAADDCDDLNAGVRPDAIELCDGIDNDCDGAIDEDDAADALTWYYDADRDGYGDPETTTESCERPRRYVGDDSVTGGWDCDDASAFAFPGNTLILTQNMGG